MIFLIVISCLVIVSMLYYNTKNEAFQTNTVTLKEFNTFFDASLIPLPLNLFALGIKEDNVKTYGNNIDNSKTFIQYWMKEIHPSMEKDTYYILVSSYDGYMEYTPYKDGEMTDLVPLDYNEHQFIEEVIEPDKYPIFHDKKIIFAMCKKTNDKHTVLVPDSHYIANRGYLDSFLKMDNERVSFTTKTPMCVWRGYLGNGTVNNFFDPSDKDGLNQRNYFKKLHSENRFPKVNFEESNMTKEDQAKFKYILDIDGFSNTWDATVWKLYSGSVLLKLKSRWKQWYYDDLKEWEHYVPIENDFSDLNDKIEWCIHNEDKCIQITKNARRFVLDKLNWERVKQDVISSAHGNI